MFHDVLDNITASIQIRTDSNDTADSEVEVGLSRFNSSVKERQKESVEVIKNKFYKLVFHRLKSILSNYQKTLIQC